MVKGAMTIIIRRPEGNTSKSTYLYNTILRRKDWVKVTLMVEEDDQMIERLNEHGIKFFKMDGTIQITKEMTNHNDVIKDLVKGITFYDWLLNNLLTDEQMEKVAEHEKEIDEANKAKEKAEEVIKNE